MSNDFTPGHLTPGQITAWRTRQLPPELVEGVAHHLAGCEACRLAAHPTGEGFRLLESLAGEHLDYEALEALANGGSRGLDHIGVCPLCATELADLRSFRQSLRPAPARRLAPRLWLPALAAAALLIGAFLWFRPAATQKTQSQATQTLSTQTLSTQTLSTQTLATLHDAAGVIALDQTGELRGLPNLTPAQRAPLAQALRTGELPPLPAPSDLIRPRETLLGDAPPAAAPKAVQPLAPAGKMVLSDRPTFRWTAPPGATHFRVTVYNLNFAEIARSPDLGDTSSWTPATPLPRDAIYLWTISASLGGQRVSAPQPPEPEARFRVLDAASAQEFAAVQARQPASRLEIAVAAARLGLREEAENALRDLARDNPGSPLAEHLLLSLRKK